MQCGIFEKYLVLEAFEDTSRMTDKILFPPGQQTVYAKKKNWGFYGQSYMVRTYKLVTAS